MEIKYQRLEKQLVTEENRKIVMFHVFTTFQKSWKFAFEFSGLKIVLQKDSLITLKNLGYALNHVFLSYKRVESMTVVNSIRNG